MKSDDRGMIPTTSMLPSRSLHVEVASEAYFRDLSQTHTKMNGRTKTRPRRIPKDTGYLQSAPLALGILNELSRADDAQRELASRLGVHRSAVGRSLKGLMRRDLVGLNNPDEIRIKYYHITVQGMIASRHMGQSQVTSLICPTCGHMMRKNNDREKPETAPFQKF